MNEDGVLPMSGIVYVLSNPAMPGLLKIGHTTQEVARQSSADLDAASLQARDELAQRRPNLNFEEMGIPIGARLCAIKSGEFVTVTGPKKVRFDNEQEDMSLTQATKRILGTEYSVAPTPHWTCEGRSLREIYNETYGD
jgi:hypothetical protein